MRPPCPLCAVRVSGPVPPTAEPYMLQATSIYGTMCRRCPAESALCVRAQRCRHVSSFKNRAGISPHSL